LVDNHGGDFAAYLAWFELKNLNALWQQGANFIMEKRCGVML